MKSRQSEDWYYQDRYEHHETHCHNRWCLIELVSTSQYVEKGEGEDTQHVDAQGDEKEKEESVISSTDAIANPGAMMIKGLR